MPKRSLNPGNDPKGSTKKRSSSSIKPSRQCWTRTNNKAPRVEAATEPLLRLAADLKDLPRESFKARLKTELIEGRKKMATADMVVASRSTRTDAIPTIAFKDAAKAIEFYKKAFGAVEVFRFEAGGSIPHAEIQIGDSVIGLRDEWPEGGRFGAETWGHSPVEFRIHVKDVDSFAGSRRRRRAKGYDADSRPILWIS